MPPTLCVNLWTPGYETDTDFNKTEGVKLSLRHLKFLAI